MAGCKTKYTTTKLTSTHPVKNNKRMKHQVLQTEPKLQHFDSELVSNWTLMSHQLNRTLTMFQMHISTYFVTEDLITFQSLPSENLEEACPNIMKVRITDERCAVCWFKTRPIVQMNYNNKKAGLIWVRRGCCKQCAVSKPDSETGYKGNHRNNSKNEHLSNPLSLVSRNQWHVTTNYSILQNTT